VCWTRAGAAHATLEHIEAEVGGGAQLVLGVLTFAASRHGVCFTTLRAILSASASASTSTSTSAAAAAAVSAVEAQLAGLLVRSSVTGRMRWRFTSLQRAAEERYLTHEPIKLHVAEVRSMFTL
jgi:hypothetical protein